MVARILPQLLPGLLVVAGFSAVITPASSQVRTDTVQIEPQDTPVVQLTVERTTPAVNYRPRRGDTEIGFAGTALLPEAEGEAEVSGEKGYMKIDARFDNLQPPQRFGREYLTYVLWAITPEAAQRTWARCSTTTMTRASK